MKEGQPRIEKWGDKPQKDPFLQELKLPQFEYLEKDNPNV